MLYKSNKELSKLSRLVLAVLEIWGRDQFQDQTPLQSSMEHVSYQKLITITSFWSY